MKCLRAIEMSESDRLELHPHKAETFGGEEQNASNYPDTLSTQNSAIQMFAFLRPNT